MKNQKIEPDILDDNYFPEEIPPSTPYEFHLFKIIGYAILNTTLFIFFNIFLFLFLAPALFSITRMNEAEALEIFAILFLASSPFLYELYRQFKEEDLAEKSWKIWVCILSLIGFMFISYIVIAISNFRFNG